jgi:hypothetical protein
MTIYKCIQTNTTNRNLDIFKDNQNKLKQQLISTDKLIKQSQWMKTEKETKRTELSQQFIVLK